MLALEEYEEALYLSSLMPPEQATARRQLEDQIHLVGVSLLQHVGLSRLLRPCCSIAAHVCMGRRSIFTVGPQLSTVLPTVTRGPSAPLSIAHCRPPARCACRSATASSCLGGENTRRRSLTLGRAPWRVRHSCWRSSPPLHRPSCWWLQPRRTEVSGPSAARHSAAGAA